MTGPHLAPASGGKARQIVILLHGYGSNGADLIGLAPGWRQRLPDALFIAPNAPEVCPGSVGGYQWWDLESTNRQALALGAVHAAPALNRFMDDQLAAHGLGEAQLLLVGFSQGTMMALHVGLRRARRLAGIIGYSGMLAETAALAGQVRSTPPVLLVHGSADTTIPVMALHEAATTLTQLGCAVESHVSPGLGHSVDAVGLELGGDFARQVLGVE